jgi:hypothetical protein
MTKQQKIEIFYTAILLLLFIGVIAVTIYFNSLVIETLQSIDNSPLVTTKEAQLAKEIALSIKEIVAPINFILGIGVGLLAPELTKQVKQLSKFKNK